MDTGDALLAEVREQTRWIRLLGLQALRPVADQHLKSDRERAAFELSDGGKSTRELGAAVGVDSKTISNWWVRWTSVGIGTTDSSGRFSHLVALAEIGLPTPKLARSPAPKSSDHDEQGA